MSNKRNPRAKARSNKAVAARRALALLPRATVKNYILNR